MKIFISIILLITFLNVQAAEPQMVPLNVLCSDTKYITDQLKTFNEIPLIMGQGIGDAKGTLMTIWANPKTKTYTILISTKDNTSCILGVGEKINFSKLIESETIKSLKMQ